MLEAYLHAVLHKNDSQLILNTDRIRVSNIVRVGGGLTNDVYSFLLHFTERHEEKQLPLIIKTFSENVDPIFRPYIHDRDPQICFREWEALRNLERVGFAAPKAYFCECDSRFLGYPFLVMAKLESHKKTLTII